MNLQELMLSAGNWASGLILRQAGWRPSSKKLSIKLYSAEPLDSGKEEALQKVFAEHFSACEVTLSIDMPEFSAPVRQEAALFAPAPSTKAQKAGGKAEARQQEAVLLGKRIARAELVPMNTLSQESGRVVVEGRLVDFEARQLPRNPDRVLLLLSVTDYTNTIRCKAYHAAKDVKKLEEKLQAVKKAGGRLQLRGDCLYDKFERDIVIQLQDMMALPGVLREDRAEEKRVELHLHTKMSAMDALTDVKAAIETAARFGHKALAITDHGVVQAFPDAYKAGAKAGIKILYGVEGYLRQDGTPIPMEGREYVVFDVETTGLKATACHLLEIGAVKIVNGVVADRFSTFVNAGVPIPQNIVALTGIDVPMIQDAPASEDALRAFRAFCGADCVFVAHNASFDVGFIQEHGERYGIRFDQPYVDTVTLSRYLLFGLRNHKLNTVCEHLNIRLDNHHRAVDDAEATAQMFLQLMDRVRGRGVDTLPAHFPAEEKGKGKTKYNHIVLIAKTQEGMKNLYRLVSHAHIDFFHQKPQIPKYLLRLFREGIIVGSACEQGEVFQAVYKGKPEEELRSLADFYDFLEIQPIANNYFMLREGMVEDEEALRGLNRRIVELGKACNKPVAATGDVHFLEPEDAVYRAILLNEMNFSDADKQPPLYLKTTDEMLEEFSYLGEDMAREVVITAPNAIADACDTLKPYPDGTFAPKIEGAEEMLQGMALGKAHAMYGEALPEPVQKRLDKELSSIIDNGFASLYLMAQRLVQKSMGDGYLVGSRGSVGSSFVATMAGITEVNPLAPHYLCPNCGHSDFDVDKGKYACGVDMPDKDCPHCGKPYGKEGFDIPFEVFLGFKGDKTPDIDLNFSGEYQPVAHKYTEEMFGSGHAFRAGTISGIKDKTAYGYVLKYLEKQGQSPTRLEIDRLCAGCSGVKRTTGQHPGGIVVVPKENDILEFTPIQYPADEKQKNTITTHFDFHALDDRLVKLDILGHDDPTALKMLQDLTGVDPLDIPLNDPDTLLLYSSSEGLGVDLKALGGCEVGSLGIPEFGTPFVRQMLLDTRPITMEELVRIAGLSHGTDVWLNNAQELVRGGVATLKEVICTRDDIMNYLIAHGGDPSMSFKTMENVRKGRGLTLEMEQAMRALDIPEWFVDSCKKIKYMFPRAHAVAYVMMSFRVAYYKYHRPEAFYAVYFTVRADAFDIRYASGGASRVLENIKAISAKGKEATNLENELLTILEVVYEMNLRGIALLGVDIYKSDATRFAIEEEGIRPPFSAVAGVGANAAQSIAENVKGQRFHTVEDFQAITGANSAVITQLRDAGCFDGMAETNQISLF